MELIDLEVNIFMLLIPQQQLYILANRALPHLKQQSPMSVVTPHQFGFKQNSISSYIAR